MFGTLGSCTRALHIVGKTTYFARARCERASSMWMPREHYTIGELAWWCLPASYPPLPAINIRVSGASVANSRTPLPHTQHQGEAPHSCAIVCFVLSSHPKIVNRGFCWAYKNEIIYYYKIAEMKSLYKAKQSKKTTTLCTECYIFANAVFQTYVLQVVNFHQQQACGKKSTSRST